MSESILCPYCGSSSPHLAFEKQGWPKTEAFFETTHDLWRCGTCDLLFSAPLDDALLGGITRFFETAYNTGRVDDPERVLDGYWSPAPRHRLRRTGRLLRHRLNRALGRPSMGLFGPVLDAVLERPVKTLLDVGCAQGLFLSLCRSAGIDAYGIEPSRVLVQGIAARTGDPVPVETGLFPAAHGPLERYDALTFNSVFLALPRVDRKLLEEIARRLAPGGRLFIAETNADLSAGDPSRDGAFRAPVWLTFVSRRFLERVAAECGFRSYDFRPVPGLPDKIIHILER